MFPFNFFFFATEKASKRETVRYTKKDNIKVKRIFKKVAVRNPAKLLGLSVCPKVSCPLAQLCLMGVYVASF